MTELAARLGGSRLDSYFRFTQNRTTLGRDTMAGVTTFIVMSYIIFVNPQILSFAGIEDLAPLGLPFDAALAHAELGFSLTGTPQGQWHLEQARSLLHQLGVPHDLTWVHAPGGRTRQR